MPTVSVIIPSYNHESYIVECLESVLNQSFQDFEIVITDDGSTDGTVEKIMRFTDPRIKLYRHMQNQGACVAANNCLNNAQGQYIAMLSSDDVWRLEKLRIQVDFLRAHPEIYAVFSKINWIDEESKPIDDPDFFYKDVFNVENRTRFEWLHHFFYGGNCLCHPSSLIRREVYDEVGQFNPGMANLPDFDLWVRLCLHHEIFVLDQKLINFRHYRNGNNASGENLPNNARVWYEARKILDHYLSINLPEEFVKVFPESAAFGDCTSEDIPFILGKLASSTDLNYKILWGLDAIYKQMQVPENAERIYKKFGFAYLDLIKLTGEHDVFGTKNYLEQLNHAAKSHGEIKTLPKQKKAKLGRLTLILKRIARKRTINEDAKLLESSGYFDAEWYLANNPDVAAGKINPVDHYLLHGGFEGRDPSQLFSSGWYLDTYSDVEQAGINPLVHYLRYGKNEGRSPRP